MNGLVSAAAEAEEILKKARWNSHPFDLNYDLESDDTSIEHNTSSWPGAGEQSYVGSFGRKRPMGSYSSHGYSPGKRERSSQSLSPVKKPAKFNIHDKLRELYDELSSDEALQANYQGLKIHSYLLEKLLTRMNLNVLIINLYPGNKGYSISLKVNGDTQMLSPPNDGSAGIHLQSDETLVETARWPYEEEDLLTYIDNEELPIVLLDLLEAEHSSLFYSGCIIAQIRDYRQAYPSFVCDTHHVLLKPTTQSIISDVNAIARAGSWGREERLLLEAAVVRATAPPLCLEPRPAVGLLAARLHHQRHLLATPAIRRQARRYSQVAVNRKRRLDQLTQQRGLGLLDIITKQRAKAATRQAANPTAVTRSSSKMPKKPSEVIRPVLAPRCESPVLVAPTDASAAVAQLARAYERPRTTGDCAPQLLEEYVLEAERSGATGPGLFHVRLSVLQRPANQEYLGELYVDRDHVDGEKNGSACRFLLGTRAHANRYIQQFTEIFTEEGRKSVRIKHLVPGQQPRVSYTAGMREMGHANQQLAMQARAQGLAIGAAQAIGAATPATPLPSVAGAVGPVAAGSPSPLPPGAPPLAPLPPTVPPSPSASPDVVLVNPPRRTLSASLPLLVRRITQAQLQAGPNTVQQLQASQLQANQLQANQLQANQLQANQQQANSPVQQVVSQIDQSNLIKTQQVQPSGTIQHIQLHQPGLLKLQNNDQQLQSVQITSQPTAAQLQQMQNAQQTANQLLAQQLTNPPQPINPHKIQQAVIHIHPIVTSQAQIQGQASGTQQHVTIQAQSGITLQGQPNLTLQGQQGLTLQGQQGLTLQGQQGLSLQGQQGLTLQGQQGLTLQGQQGLTLQGQQGLTLQGQQGLTLQGQQGLTLQGQQKLQNQQGVNIQQQGITLQGQTVNLQGQQTISLASQQVNNVNQVTQKQKVAPPMQRTTNPAISALVTSLMNSAHQFQQAAAANAAAKSTSNNNSASPSNNATILNLLNSAPAAMTNSGGEGTPVKKGGGGTPSALLERLMAPPTPSPTNNQNSQLGGLMPGVQNVQVQIPGIPQPISLSLSSSVGASGGLLVSVPVSSQAPTPTQSLLSLPITQLMARDVKSGTPLQLVQRPRVGAPQPRQLQLQQSPKLPNSNTITAGTVQYISQQQSATLAAHQQRRRANPNEPGK